MNKVHSFQNTWGWCVKKKKKIENERISSGNLSVFVFWFFKTNADGQKLHLGYLFYHLQEKTNLKF